MAHNHTFLHNHENSKSVGEKIKDFWDNNGVTLLASGIIVVVIASSVVVIDYAKSKGQEKNMDEKEQFKQEIIQAALDAFRQEQAKTINYSDSVKQNVR